MSKYDPTINPGDTRIRSRYIGIRIPISNLATVEVLEQNVVRLAEGEKVLEDLSGLTSTIDVESLAEVIEERDRMTDTLTGNTLTGAQIQDAIYSWVRHMQLKRDEAEIVVEVVEEPVEE